VIASGRTNFSDAEILRPYVFAGGPFAACDMTPIPTGGRPRVAPTASIEKTHRRSRFLSPLANIRAFALFRILLSRRILHAAKVRLRAISQRAAKYLRSGWHSGCSCSESFPNASPMISSRHKFREQFAKISPNLFPNSHGDDFFAHLCYNKPTARAEFTIETEWVNENSGADRLRG